MARTLARAVEYAKTRVVFDRPIGQNQSIQHPLAENWMELEAAYLMASKAAWLYDHGEACGAESTPPNTWAARPALKRAPRR